MIYPRACIRESLWELTTSAAAPQHQCEMGRIGVLFELRHADTMLVTESEPRGYKTVE